MDIDDVSPAHGWLRAICPGSILQNIEDGVDAFEWLCDEFVLGDGKAADWCLAVDLA